MTVTLAATSPANTPCDALIVPVSGKGSDVRLLGHGFTEAATAAILDSLAAVGASGKSGDVTKIPATGRVKATVIVAVGFGEVDLSEVKAADLESIRRAVGNAVRDLGASKKVAIVTPPSPAVVGAIASAARLATYRFTSFKGKSAAGGPVPPRSIVLVLPKAPSAADKAAVNEANVIADAMFLTRDLVNTPPNALPPAALALAAKDAVAGLPIKVTIWDERALARHGCGGILGVGQGSANPPRLVRMEYSPAGATQHLAIVGKGITFDTGGISIKPAANMDEMKGDMAGAAAVVSAIQAIARLKVKVKVTAYVPSAENMPSGTAQRPGDVIRMYDGTTVEVLNTDAEGRLILADALGMAVKEKPTLIIDAATLTGAQRVALGSRIAGVMSNDVKARERVCDAAERAGETMWPMPLPEDLRSALDSATADLANIGDRLGGMLSAGVFLNEFIPAKQPWVHLDIAGPAFNEKGAYGYTPKGGTGAAVRTLVQVAKDLAAG
jgi:leucyl aminopeptidase